MVIEQQGFHICLTFKKSVGVELIGKIQRFNTIVSGGKMLWGKDGTQKSCAMFMVDNLMFKDELLRHANHFFGTYKIFEISERFIKKD